MSDTVSAAVSVGKIKLCLTRCRLAQQIKIAFASVTDDLNPALIREMRRIFPELPLWVVSDFPPSDRDLKWIPWHMNRTFLENRGRCRGHEIRLAGMMLVPNVPFRRMHPWFDPDYYVAQFPEAGENAPCGIRCRVFQS